MNRPHQQPFFRTEDFWAIAIAGFLLLTGLAFYFSMLSADVKQKITATSAIIQSEVNKPIKTIAWHEATSELTRLKLSDDLNRGVLKNDWRTNVGCGGRRLGV